MDAGDPQGERVLRAKFALLDAAFGFLTRNRAVPSVRSVLSMANNLRGASDVPLTAADLHELAHLAPHVLVISERSVGKYDVFRPTEPTPQERKVIAFPLAPQSSKRASAKRQQLFVDALAASTASGRLAATARPADAPTPLETRDSPPPDFAALSTGAAYSRWLRVLQSLPFYDRQLVHVERRPPRAAQLREIAALPLPPRVQTALANCGIQQLYAHQFEAVDALLTGANVVLSTATASGKSLAYNVPMLTALLEDARSTFLYLFPTKALAQDQLKSLRSFLAAADLPLHFGATIVVVDEAHMYRGVFGSHVACVFRRLFRLCALYGANPRVVCCSATIRNPQQHFELLIPTLPARPRGSGDDPCPPPFDYFRSRPLRVITEDGAPTGEKFFCLWNPKASSGSAAANAAAAMNAAASSVPTPPRKRTRESGSRDDRPPSEAAPPRSALASLNDGSTAQELSSRGSTSPIFQSASIFARFMQEAVHTLLFVRGRKLSELVLMTVHSVLGDDKALLRRVSTYRGGYTLNDRRAIERRLFSGELLGVIATNALELGIDVGDLDCTMHLGLPSSAASLWQQAGRAGRKHTQQSIAVVVCFDSPLDQHFARHAPELFQLQPEAVALNPSNVRVLGQHLLCAARESPLYANRSGMDYVDAFMFGRLEATARGSADSVGVAPLLAELVQEQKLLRCPPSDGGGYRLHSCMPKQFRAVNLRSIAEFVYQVVTDDAEQKVLDEIPGDTVFLQVYPTGVYLHQAQEYVITKVDNENKVVYAKKCAAPLKYFTACKDITHVDVVRVQSKRRVHADDANNAGASDGGGGDGDAQLWLSLGVVSVLTRVYGATVLEKRTLRHLYSNEFSLPPMQTFGNALWLELPRDLRARVESAGLNWVGALHGVGHLCVALVSLFVLCESADVNTEHYNPLEQRVRPNRITIYERREGGSGVLDEIHRVLPQCACGAGCPGCIHSGECSEFNSVLDKRGALLVLDFLQSAFAASVRAAPAVAAGNSSDRSTGEAPETSNL
ncbi:hypothetical protein PybrP1_003240 [[Pythium] brassicae (nom. inval.)]|nr:hypothetical protein PybrP1_003240 [[Pythium] brassicae (nom. inval.)]